MAFNPGNMNQWSPLNSRGPQLFGYYTTDTVATVSNAAYFRPNSPVNLNPFIFSVGDNIQATCSDGSVYLNVTSIAPITTAAEVIVIAVGPNSVNTAAIQDLAVTVDKVAADAITNVKVAAAAAIAFSKLAALPSAQILVGSAGNVATATAVTGDVTISNAGVTAIGAAKVTKAMLAATVRPSHMIVFADQVTTVGGAAAEAFAVAGALAATDRAFVQVVDDGTANVTVLQAVVTNDTLTVTFSANPGNDAVINYQIIRATS